MTGVQLAGAKALTTAPEARSNPGVGYEIARAACTTSAESAMALEETREEARAFMRLAVHARSVLQLANHFPLPQCQTYTIHRKNSTLHL